MEKFFTEDYEKSDRNRAKYAHTFDAKINALSQFHMLLLRIVFYKLRRENWNQRTNDRKNETRNRFRITPEFLRTFGFRP